MEKKYCEIRKNFDIPKIGQKNDGHTLAENKQKLSKKGWYIFPDFTQSSVKIKKFSLLNLGGRKKIFCQNVNFSRIHNYRRLICDLLHANLWDKTKDAKRLKMMRFSDLFCTCLLARCTLIMPSSGWKNIASNLFSRAYLCDK